MPALHMVSYVFLRWVLTRRMKKGHEVQILGRVPRDWCCIIASNHLDVHDHTAIASALPFPVAFVAKNELFQGLQGRLMLAAKQIPVNRECPDYRALIKHTSNRTLLRMAVGIFPEGTRSKTGELGSFHEGVGSIARINGLPIIPVGIVYIPREGKKTLIRVNFGEPIPSLDTNGRRKTSALTEETREAIERLIQES